MFVVGFVLFYFVLDFVGRGSWISAQIHVQETVHIRNIFMSIESAVL